MPSAREPGLVFIVSVSKEESQHTRERTDIEFTVSIVTLEGTGECVLRAVTWQSVSYCGGKGSICHDGAHVRVERFSGRGLSSYLPDGLCLIFLGYDPAGVGLTGLCQGWEGWACCLVQPRLQQKHI